MATQTGLQALKAASGQIDWAQPSGGRLPSLGRGSIAGGWLYWPTQYPELATRAVRLGDGNQQLDGEASVLPEPSYLPPEALARLPAGNWAMGQGCLAIAGLSELVVFVPPDRQPGRYPMDLRPDARLDRLYHDARIHAVAGRNAEAARAYQELLAATKSDPHAADWRRLIDARLAALDAQRPAAIKLTMMPPAQEKIEPRPMPNHPVLPLVQAWHHRQTGPTSLWPGDDSSFFCTQPGSVACRSLTDGGIRWRRALDFAPAWLEQLRDLVVLAGPDAVEARQVKDGTLAWSFTAPSRRFKPWSVIDGKPLLAHASAGFVHCERWDDTLLLLDDGRRFIRLRLDSGEIVWQYADQAADLRPMDAAAFEPFLLRLGDRVLAQSNTGQPGWIGARPMALGEKSRPWRQPPIVVGDRIILAAERGRVMTYDAKPPHRLAWSHQAPFATSLSGGLCRLIGNGSIVLAITPRNEGDDWTCIDAASGRQLWTVPARHLLGADAGSICIGDASIFFAIAGRLQARSINNGAVEWSQPLAGENRAMGRPLHRRLSGGLSGGSFQRARARRHAARSVGRPVAATIAVPRRAWPGRSAADAAVRAGGGRGWNLRFSQPRRRIAADRRRIIR